jgi:hypothetical protein
MVAIKQSVVAGRKFSIVMNNMQQEESLRIYQRSQAPLAGSVETGVTDQ